MESLKDTASRKIYKVRYAQSRHVQFCGQSSVSDCSHETRKARTSGILNIVISYIMVRTDSRHKGD